MIIGVVLILIWSVLYGLYLYGMNQDLYFNAGEDRHKITKEYPKIKFSDFKKYYLLNPKSWKLLHMRVIKGHNIRVNSQDPCFTFGFFDWLQYKIFIKTLRRKEKYTENSETYIKLLELVQQDIDKLKENTTKNNIEAINTIIEIEERLKR